MKRYNIKKVIYTGLALAVCLLGLTACGSGSNDSNKYQSDGNSVEDALNSQMAKEDAEKETETTEADIWTAVAQDNGTFKVNNVARNKYVQLDASYGTYGAYDTEKGSMPFLYLLDESTTGINTVKTVRVDDGAIYNLAGQKVDKSYKGVVVKNGKKMVQK